MKEREVACVVFYDKQNRLLIQDRRKISKQGEQYGWFGGGMEQGETPEQTLTRELNEELGQNITNFKFLIKYDVQYPTLLARCNLFIAPAPKYFDVKEGKAVLVTMEEAQKMMMNNEELAFAKIGEYLK
jgi:mutator protein MutT